MLTDTERRRLQEQGLGELWHEDASNIYHPCSCTCGAEFGESGGALLPIHLFSENRTFAYAQDYEDLLDKVVRENVFEFTDYLISLHYGTVEVVLRWFLALSIEERCKLVHDFGVEVLGWE
jgi:hypothetical protein